MVFKMYELNTSLKYYIIVLKSFIDYLIGKFVDLFIGHNKNITPRSILLIRLDAIGDYILFRNFMELLKKSEKYHDYEITLLGNSAWKDIALELDSEYIKKFIWINKKKFLKNPVYRFKMLNELSKTGYEIVIHPTYSRELLYGDWIVKTVSAKEKIASVGDLSNISKWQKKLGDKWYTKLLPAKKDIIFEFYRNREFFEKLLDETITIEKPSIDVTKIKNKMELPKNYAVLFLGASANFRKWPIDYFVVVAEHLKTQYGMNVILAGGPNDKSDAEFFEKKYSGKIYNFVGKTSLLELLTVIQNANIMISNETSAPHMAMALGKPKVIVISNGNHLGRFTPHPDTNGQYHVIFHPNLDKNSLKISRGKPSGLDIKEIRIDDVISKIDKILNN